MKGGVEAGDLRHVRAMLAHRLHQRDLRRRVLGRERDQRAQLGEDGIVDADRRGEARAAVHDAMADGGERRVADRGEDLREMRCVIGVRDALDGVAGDLAQLGCREERELETGGAGVERQDHAVS